MVVEWTRSEDKTGRASKNQYAKIGFVGLSVGPEGAGKWWWCAGIVHDEHGEAPSEQEAKDAAVAAAVKGLAEMYEAGALK